MSKLRGADRLWQWKALVAVLVVVVAALLASMIIQSTSGDGNSQGSESQQAQPQTGPQHENPLESLARREPGDPLARGRADAPVVMISVEDFRCPFCAKFSTDTAPTLIERYVETGVLRIEWRDMPIFGEQSMLAAHAGRAAARQDKFWAFHDVVFAHAPETGHPDLPLSMLIDYASEAGVPDIEQFKADVDDPAIAQAVQADAMQSTRLGITATPAFIINGQPVMGAQPQQVFVQAIEQARKQA